METGVEGCLLLNYELIILEVFKRKYTYSVSWVSEPSGTKPNTVQGLITMIVKTSKYTAESSQTRVFRYQAWVRAKMTIKNPTLSHGGEQRPKTSINEKQEWD